jgi:hypothetical protein
MEQDIVNAPYSQQELWADVSPIYVDDGNSVVAVQYTPEHREALSYFRAALVSGEKSVRVLQLAANMIHLNMADYTAWQLRWSCVEALDSSLEDEYQFTEDIMKVRMRDVPIQGSPVEWLFDESYGTRLTMTSKMNKCSAHSLHLARRLMQRITNFGIIAER